MPGSPSQRVEVVTASARNLPARGVLNRLGYEAEVDLYLPAE
jgi:hypothetical protein